MKSGKLRKLVSGLILVLLSAQNGWCQSMMSYQAYLVQSQVMWKKIVDQSSKETFERALALYGLLNGTMANRDEEEFHQYYEATITLLEQLADAGDHEPECMAIQSAIYGLELAYNSWKGMFLGPKSAGLINDAYELAPDNPLVVKLYASSKLYTPEMFGGDIQLAVQEFSRSLILFEKSASNDRNWIYLDALAHLGIAYQRAGQLDLALDTFDKALLVEPSFNWVKSRLRPKVLEEIASR